MDCAKIFKTKTGEELTEAVLVQKPCHYGFRKIGLRALETEKSSPGKG